MLPVPFSPSSTWATYRITFGRMFDGANPRVVAAFWLFGLINNVLYVIILSAALDLVGPALPKAIVLLADVLPSFFVKLVAPYFIHHVPYALRVPILVSVSIFGMLMVAVTSDAEGAESVGIKLVGIILASLSSGGGELSFLALTHFYGHSSLAAWGSGTGGAGLVGASAYVFATTTFGLSVPTSMLVFSTLPIIMLLAFFVVLPRGPLKMSKATAYSRLNGDALDDSIADLDSDIDEPLAESRASMLNSLHSVDSLASSLNSTTLLTRTWQFSAARLRRTRRLIIPYMIPLFVVYFAEYTINQGVTPTLLFPLQSTPFRHFREFYPTYNAIYQTGVFISRSSTPFFRIHNLYVPSLLQAANLCLLTLHALYGFIPSVYSIFLIIFGEGLLGGLVYINAFAEVTDNVPMVDREFSLAATSVSDSAGICLAGFAGMAMEIWLCNWQTKQGRDFCHQT